MTLFVLVHSPLAGVLTWAHVANVLWEREVGVVVPGLHCDVEAWRAGTPYWSQHVDQIRESLSQLPSEGPEAVEADEAVVLVGHSGAGSLLPAVGAAIERPVAAYVFCDAGVPRDGASRFEGFGSAEVVESFQRSAVDGMMPPFPAEAWEDAIPDAGVRREFMQDLRSTPLEVYEEPLPVAATWPDAPVAYLGFRRSREMYAESVKRALAEGWPFSELEGGHFQMLVDPERVARGLLQLCRKCGVEL